MASPIYPPVPDRVARGARLLEELLPGWPERIDLEAPDQTSELNGGHGV